MEPMPGAHFDAPMLERSSLGPSSSGAGGSPFLAVGLRYHLAASRVIDVTLIKANGAMWIPQARVLPGKEESRKAAYAEGAGTRRTCSALQRVGLLTEFLQAAQQLDLDAVRDPISLHDDLPWSADGTVNFPFGFSSVCRLD